MILIGLGANLPSSVGRPVDTLEAAIGALRKAGVKVLARSRWYQTAPVPPSDQPWFVNGVAAVETNLEPIELLAVLQKIERQYGRQAGPRNAARTLDLDILDYDGEVVEGPKLILPHPRMEERAFVLLPLAEVAPEWRHPKSDRAVAALIASLPVSQHAEPLPP